MDSKQGKMRGMESLVVTPDALDAVRKARKEAQGMFGLRPELSLVATALILEGAKSPAINETIRQTVLKAFGLPVDAPQAAADKATKAA